MSLPEIGKKLGVIVKKGKGEGSKEVIFSLGGLICLPSRKIKKKLLREARKLLSSWGENDWDVTVEVCGHARSGKAIFVDCDLVGECDTLRKKIIEKEQERVLCSEKERRTERRDLIKYKRREIAKCSEKKFLKKRILAFFSSLKYQTEGEKSTKVLYTESVEECYNIFNNPEGWEAVPEEGSIPDGIEWKIKTQAEKVPEFHWLSPKEQKKLVRKVIQANYVEITWRYRGEDYSLVRDAKSLIKKE